MKKSNSLIIYLSALIISGSIFLYKGIQNLGLDTIKLPDIYLKVFYLELVIIAGMTILSLLWLMGAFIFRQRNAAIMDGLDHLLDRSWVKWLMVSSFGLMSVFSGQMILQSPQSSNQLTSSFLVLNRPFFAYLATLSLLSLIFISQRLGLFRYLKEQEVKIPILVFLVLLLIFAGIDLSRFGFQKSLPGGGSFRLTGFPILDYQLVFSWLAVMAASWGFSYAWTKSRKLRDLSPVLIDILIGLVLFLGAFYVWQSAPVIANAFIDKPRPPNFQFYPNLDAVVYDRTALNLLASGEWQTYIGGLESVGRRPLFTLYLAVLHWISRGDYGLLITLQVAVFALLPVLVYQFTKSIHNRISGILTAILIIIRNLNGVWLQEDVWGGTSLHMLMSDILATIIVIVFLSFLLRWINDDSKNPSLSILTGGILGLGMLIRQELLVLLAAALLIVLIKAKSKFRTVIGKMLLISAGTLLIIFPWMVRNYVKTGQIYLDKPGKIAELTSKTLPGIVSKLSTGDETQEIFEEPAAQETEDVQDPQLDPVELSVFSSMMNHYANALPQTVLYLPSNPVWASVDYLYRLRVGEYKPVYGSIFYSPYSYTKTLPYWWFDQWEGKIASQSWIYLGLNIALISVGLYQSWKKNSWNVMSVILALIAMISIYVLILRSGGRFMQTVDWISAMFLSIGLVHLSDKALKNLSIDQLSQDSALEGDRQRGPGSRSGRWIALILIFMIGVSPVIVEAALENKYPESAKDLRLDEILKGQTPGIAPREQKVIEEYLKNGGEILYGEALYPRYFSQDAALMTTNETLFPGSTTFTVAGSELNFVVLPRLEPPEFFPQGAEVLVVGCRESSLPPDPGFPCLGCLEDEFEALVVMIFPAEDQSVQVYWHDRGIDGDLSCPH